MFRIIGLFLVVNWVVGENFLIEETGRRRVVYGTTDKPVIKSGVSPNTVDNIFQIPISVIEGTSTAAQSWYPENSDTINKIPVQTLQAISNLVKDRLTQEAKPINEEEVKSLKKKISEENVEPENEDFTTRKRHAYLGWDWPLTDLFFGHDQGFHGHGHKKKKRKPHNLNGHFGNHGSHGHLSHHGLFGNRNSNSNNIGQPILGGDGNIYHVTETLDDAVQIGLWKPYSGIIQNKIAPDSRFRF
ncbi:uncharacterized protein LOC123273260 isoform X2 [Cotesia glomerata]|uniref:uncharacterized protein LOC123273260 isoform X2 n=1 Tax=Cotesia glomerata TaxID=32391 RepID=UPI001D02248C|nr:uncharacterized protein LOC123273260 isoform X2 [Cotesia glomerata]